MVKLLKNNWRSSQKKKWCLKDLKPNTQELTIENIIQEDVLNDEAKNELNKL